jgi:hypothetical protein
MFADPFSNLMLVMLLFFCGLLIMFIFMMRSLDNNWRNQEETRRQMDLSLSDLERKVDELLYIARQEGGPRDVSASPPGDFPAEDKLASAGAAAASATAGCTESGAEGKRQFGDLKLSHTLPDMSAVFEAEGQGGKNA